MSERTDYAEMAVELVERRLQPQGFSHRAHLGVAYEILSRHEAFEAMACYAGGLRHLTEVAGVPEKFNATVTMAFLSLVAERQTRKGYASVEEFLEDNSDLLSKEVLSCFYDASVLASDLARRAPLLPRPERSATLV